jgi:hypothetical protein
MVKETKLTEKQQELHDRLLAKTLANRIEWYIRDADMFYMVLGEFQVSVLSNWLMVPAIVVCLRKDGDHVTSFSVPDEALFIAAREHCPERNRILANALAALDLL